MLRIAQIHTGSLGVWATGHLYTNNYGNLSPMAGQGKQTAADALQKAVEQDEFEDFELEGRAQQEM